MSLPSRLSLALLITLSASAPVMAQTVTAEGQADQPLTQPPPLPEMAAIEQAWKRGDFVYVRDGLARLAAETGTALAQYRYGQVLLEGRGGPRDPGAAQFWLQKAADQDHVRAITLLARLYLSGAGTGVARDPATAAALLARAATRGDREAQYYLGLLVSAGDGVPKDETDAVNWFLAAAEQEHVNAQYALSRAYSRGAGVAENPTKALHWLTQAAENGHAEAQFYLAFAYDSGKGVPASPNQAIQWYRRAAEGGHILAQRILGTKYLQGDGVGQNPQEALRWLVPAAKAGEPGAMSNLGYMYASGTGVPADDSKAFSWYKQAADSGVGRAMLALGRFYETGRGVGQDTARAVSLYRQAMQQQVPGATKRLTRMTLDGALDSVVAPQDAVSWMAAEARQDNAPALDWLKTKAETGMRAAQTALGLIYVETGNAPQAAATFLTLAAEAGDTQAQLSLGKLYTTGTGVELDYVAAHKWLNIAAAGGVEEAGRNRDLITKLMTPEQIATAQSITRTFFETARTRPPAPQNPEQESQ